MTLIPSAEIIDAREWSLIAYQLEGLVFITAADAMIGWDVYGAVYDAQEESLPVHLLDLDTMELVPAQELHLVSTALFPRGRTSWTRFHYVFRRWPFELFVMLASFLRHFRKVA
jgi:hypothetical protein